MGWDQVAVILVTVVLAVLTGTTYNNRRIDDVNRRLDDVHRRIDDLRQDMNTNLKQLREDMNARLNELRSLLQEKSRTG